MRLPWDSQALITTKFLVALGVVCLFFSVTNLIPLSALLVPFIVLTPILILNQNSQHRLIVTLITLWIYFLISTLLYSPSALLSYNFYRRDGNFFISFAPLLLLGAHRIQVDTDSIIRRFIYHATATNGVFLLIYAITGGTVWLYEQDIYHFLFIAHNAAGGFLAVLASYSLGYYAVTKNRKFIFLSLINIIGLYATDSRGSILALIAALVTVFVLKGRKNALIVVTAVLSQVLLFAWLFSIASPSIYLGSPEGMDATHLSDFTDRGSTILQRTMVFWPKAIHFWIHSPLFGTGFGSYNDNPYNLEGLKHVFMWNEAIQFRFNDGHAHHTFLHIAAETGILGLLVVFLLLLNIYKFASEYSKPAVSLGLILAFWVIVFSSFTEHRLFTPSQMLPFTIILGLSVADARWMKKQLKNNLAVV